MQVEQVAPILKLNLKLQCWSQIYVIILKRRTAIIGTKADAAARLADGRNKQVIFKNCTPFTDCKNEINYTK